MPYFHLFSAFTSHLETIVAQGGYIFLFLTTMLEGIPLIGMAIPGHVAIIIAGFLAKIGLLDLWLVLLLGVVGAMIGDYIGFYLGRKYGLSFIDRLRPYFFITDQHIEKASNLLARHTGKALIIGRFSPVTRPLMPFLVGASKTSEKRFWVFNTIGGASWAILSVFIGYIFGAGYHIAAGYLGKFAMFAIVVSIIIIWGYHFVNVRFHIFRRYELFMLILNLFSIYGLARTIQDARFTMINPICSSKICTFDVYLNQFFDGIDRIHPFIVTISEWVTNIGGTAVMTVLGVLLIFWFLFRKRWRSAVVTFISIGSTGLFLGLMKAFFMRARPDNALILITNDPSFPSGHAAMVAALLVVVAYLFAPKIKSRFKREFMIVLCVLAIIAVGLSRVVLNVHWASDVVAGWSLGIFFATASVLLVRYVGVLVVGKTDRK
ncbi:MAG: bifunctional DedA family/phosphatase PAP2 family protein [Patescibacteria group bacterium]